MDILCWLATGGAGLVALALCAGVFMATGKWLLERSGGPSVVRRRVNGMVVVYDAETGQPLRVEHDKKLGGMK